MEDASGMKGNVCAHFGQCKYFLIADIDNESKNLKGAQVVPNTSVHGGGGCVAVDEMLKYGITHVIAGGMGMGAQQKFANAGVRVYGSSGKVEEAINGLIKDTLGGLGACKDHGEKGMCH